jgi:hypothetical protein
MKTKNPYYIALTGLFTLLLFIVLPIDSGYELALTYVPFFFLLLGIVLAAIYWALAQLMKKQLKLLYYFFIIVNILWGTLIAIDMAYKIFNF